MGKPHPSRSVNSDDDIFTYEFIKGLALLKTLETNTEQIIYKYKVIKIICLPTNQAFPPQNCIII